MSTIRQKTPCIRRLVLASILLLLSGCAQVTPRPASPPLTRDTTEGIVSTFKAQITEVHTLFSSGTLTVHSRGSKSEATLLIVAATDPSRIKIEITHSWGRPLLHILINALSVDILSFSEKKSYSGQMGHQGLSKLIPVPLIPELLWSLARAYPVLLKHHRVLSLKGDQITLFDRGGDKVQVIDLYPESDLPQRVSFCHQKAHVIFSDFKDKDGILYAGEIGLNDADDNAGLRVEIRNMIFNKPVPEAIFKLRTPSDFEWVTH